jgi:hypothetical protein
VTVRRAFAFVTFVLVTPACGILFSVDGYEGSGSGDGSVEVSADSPGADVADGGATGDTQPPSDAARDGDAIGDAGDGAPWCATQTHEAGVWYRCFDYDEPDSAPIAPNTGGGATIVVQHADDAATSPPGALVVTIPQLMPYPDSAFATDMLASGGGTQEATLAFDLRTDATDDLFIAAMQWGNSSSGHAVYYAISISGAGDLQVLEQAYGDGGGIWRYPTDAGVVDFSTAHRYELTVSMATGAATLRLDGNGILDAGGHYGGVWQLTFTWGVSYISGKTLQADVYHFDNVVLEGR